MEAGAQYALHDDEARPQWAARVRLTPELLDKLRHDPQQVLFRLNVTGPDGVSKTRNPSKKTSLMTVQLATDDAEETLEQYELLSFAEDPRINHVCTFRKEGDGYHIYKTGAIHQKLLVQRLLDDTEKDRIKDKHAKSVLASKSRSSKLIEAEPEAPAKRQRLMTRVARVPTARVSTGSSAWSIAAGRKRKLVLPSALSKEDAQEARERIEKGFEVEQEETAVASMAEENEIPSGETTEDEAISTVYVSAKTAAAARETGFHDLFSSDSDDKEAEQTEAQAKRREKKRAAKAVKAQHTTATSEVAICAKQSDNDVQAHRTADSAQDAELDACAQPKESDAKIDAADRAAAAPATDDTNSTKTVRSDTPKAVYSLPPVKPSGGEVKRARVRSTLLPDRVKASQLPNLSYFPPVVVQVCQRLAKHHGRSVILDDSDYDSFVETHEQFRRDWEVLDKAYSIEIIKTEALHLQLEVASTDANRGELEAKIQASSSKREGLTFVRDAMVSVQKILHSIQMSIHNFDVKHPPIQLNR